MNKIFTSKGWEDYLYWQKENKKILNKINELIKDIERNGNIGIGKPEALKGNLSGYWSRRIDQKHRLIYSIDESSVYIIKCKNHKA
jgi:toxin YoeB